MTIRITVDPTPKNAESLVRWALARLWQEPPDVRYRAAIYAPDDTVVEASVVRSVYEWREGRAAALRAAVAHWRKHYRWRS